MPKWCTGALPLFYDAVSEWQTKVDDQHKLLDERLEDLYDAKITDAKDFDEFKQIATQSYESARDRGETVRNAIRVEIPEIPQLCDEWFEPYTQEIFKHYNDYIYT